MAVVEDLTDVIQGSGGKIVLFVLDGLGGFRTAERPSELHEARTPNLDRLASEGSSGLHTPVAPGITPGSGAGHLALFGYDPLVYELGRGALSAAGIGFDLRPGDVAARVNYCTLDESGNIIDRRAGRIPTDENARLCEKIRKGVAPPEGCEFFIETEREHRALLVLRGEGLSPEVSDTDPQQNGVPPLDPEATSPEGAATAEALSLMLRGIREVLDGEDANFILLRGFDTQTDLPSLKERYALDGLAIAGYPMYRGVARLLGMTVDDPRSTPDELAQALKTSWDAHGFFYLHYKAPDTAGEDGDFDAKVSAIEEADASIAAMMEVSPDVFCVTGDHATPAVLRSHSWHPVPFIMWGPRVPRDLVERFDEEEARLGGFGQLRGKELMPLMLAAAGRLKKFGA